MNKNKSKRGYYFLVKKQDSFKRDVWFTEAVVFAISARDAAEIFVQAYCQETDFIFSFEQKARETYEFLLKGQNNYECKYELSKNPELELEIPTFLR